MKLIRIVLAAIFLVFAIPLEAFCQDEHCAEAASACTICCYHPASLDAVIAPTHVFYASLDVVETFSSYDLTYENPTISRLIKPPIVVS